MRFINKTLLAISVSALLCGTAMAAITDQYGFKPNTSISGGKSALKVVTGKQAQSIGGGVSTGTWTKSQDGVAIGTGAMETDSHNVPNSIYGETGTAVGAGSVGLDASTALGGNAQANNGGVALGANSLSTDGSVSVGDRKSVV